VAREIRSAKLTVSSSGRWARARWGWAGGRESRRSRTAQLSAPHSVLSDQHLLDATNLGYRTSCLSILEDNQCLKGRDGILVHQFTKRLESFAHAIHSPFYWQILGKTILYSVLIIMTKKSAKQETSSLLMNRIL
jgi:hypothetical protein